MEPVLEAETLAAETTAQKTHSFIEWVFFFRKVFAHCPPISPSTFRLFKALPQENRVLLPESGKFGGLLGYTVNIELGFV